MALAFVDSVTRNRVVLISEKGWEQALGKYVRRSEHQNVLETYFKIISNHCKSPLSVILGGNRPLRRCFRGQGSLPAYARPRHRKLSEGHSNV